MTYEQQWIEYDFNPFILFSSTGKIVSLNGEAQYLLGSADAATIFDIATTYASSSFGFKTTFMDLEFGRFKFFGITVGYEDEEHIGIRLYQMPSFKFNKPKATGELVNIYTLLDLCISSNSIGTRTEFTKNVDPTIPDIRLHTDMFIKLLNKVYSAMKQSERIHTELFFRVGEYIKFEEKKYTLFAIEISGDNVNPAFTQDITALAEENHLYVEVNASTVSINIPLIRE